MASKELEQKLQKVIDEIWTQGNLERIDEYMTQDYVEHRPEGDVEGLDNFRQFISTMHQAYPDLQVEGHEVVANDNLVAGNFTFEGTQSGEMPGIGSTGERLRVDGTIMMRAEGGKFVEAWSRFDMLNALVQLGAVPMPEAVEGLREAIEGGGAERGGTTRPRA